MSKIITKEQYRAAVDELSARDNVTVADNAFIEKVDALQSDWLYSIVNNNKAPEFTGTAFYVSNKGNDDNDGLTPETAWATLEKVNKSYYNNGDAVLFERGGIWRGQLLVLSGTTYAAYGTGDKPRIYNSVDCLNHGKWVKTDIANVWKLDEPINQRDFGVVVFNNGESYAEKKYSFSEIKNDLDFVFNAVTSFEEEKDNKLYLRCDKGNPAEIFNEIEGNCNGSVINFRDEKVFDITIENLDISYGTDYFFPSRVLTNVILRYCLFRWSGGHAMVNGEGVPRKRFCGGGGCWFGCKNLRFECCYFLQHFDAGTSPQYSDHNNNRKVVFEDYIVTDSVFDKCEYPFEYFIHCSDGEESLKSKFVNNYFGYNFMTGTGKGFGDKHEWAGIKGWSGQNFAENCLIEKNIYDRPYEKSGYAISISAREAGNGMSQNYLDKKELFKLKSNIYIVKPDVNLVTANESKYAANEEGIKNLIKDGVEENPILVLTK